MDRFSGLPFDEPRIGHIDPQDQDKKRQKARIEAVRGKAGRETPIPSKRLPSVISLMFSLPFWHRKDVHF